LAGLSPAGMAASLAAPEPYGPNSGIRLVWGFLCQECITPFLSCFVTPFFCSTRAASILPSRPHMTVAVARSGGQGRRFFSAAVGLSLTDASTAAGCRDRVIRCAMIRGEPAIGREQSREPRLYSVEPTWVPTMKQSYASAGKAPRRRVHSPSGIAAIAVCGLPPPRIVIGYPGASSAVRCRTLFVLSRSRVLLTPPAATRHRPAPHRS
jgi:hypothetical protein